MPKDFRCSLKLPMNNLKSYFPDAESSSSLVLAGSGSQPLFLASSISPQSSTCISCGLFEHSEHLLGHLQRSRISNGQNARLLYSLRNKSGCARCSVTFFSYSALSAFDFLLT